MSTRSKKVTESEIGTLFADDSTLWPEWSDTALNKENWTIPKNGADGLFLDPQPIELPPFLVPHEWMRANNLPYLTRPLTVYVPDSDYLDPLANNKHLLHSEFVRWLVSALLNLEHCGRNGLEISGENGDFIWNGRHQAWHGWMNVYSMNKAGKGALHRPTLNPNGKYIVRLYFLGCWRRILVDDVIPVNADGLPLLPRTSNNFELWPMLLSKALLKICCLTWNDCNEIVDFHPVTCLTGWVCLRMDVAYLSPQDKWDFLRKYADHFEWKEEIVEQEDQEAVKLRTSHEAKMSRTTIRSRKSKNTILSRRSKDTEDSKISKDTDRVKSRKRAEKPKALSKPQPVTLFLGLDDMRELPGEVVPGVSPCWGHFVYIEQSRDIPLDPKDVKPPLARWKLYRWLKWAISEGIIDPIEYFMPIRSLKVVSPLKKCDESVISRYLDDTKVEQNPRNGFIGQKATTAESSRQSREKSSTDETPEEINFWADFNKMEPYVRDVHFFYKLDYFQYTVRLSDRFVPKESIEQRSEAKKSSKKGSRKSSPARTTFIELEFIDTYGWPKKMARTRNEPLYILVDSLEEKFFLIEFSTFQVVPTSPEENEDETNPTNVQRGDKSYLILEKHNWFRRPEKSNCLLAISTAGTRSVVVELGPGRHLLRMYCRSETNCFTTISSDTMFHVGDRKKMYQLMSIECDRIDQLAKHISYCVSSAYHSFGTEAYPEALRAYLRSYLPPVQKLEPRNKQFYDQIRDYFMDEMVQLIRKTMDEKEVPDVLRALRIFFLNPNIGFECFNTISKLLDRIQGTNVPKNPVTDPESDSDEPILTEDQAATILQSFFKMLTVRKYKQIHDPRHVQYQSVLENLLKVANLFNYDSQESLANTLLRNLLKHHDKLNDVYPFSRDCEYTLQVQEVKGLLHNVKPNQWLPITRLVVNCRPTETVLAVIDMFVALPRYSVRMFNNETGVEMSRVVNNVIFNRYQQSRLGYTIVCYGWSEELTFKELSWTLNVITVKQQPIFYSLDTVIPLSTATVPPTLMVEELSNTYVPNSQNFISRLIARVAKPSIVSFRLKTCYEHVRMRFTVTDERENVVARVTSTSVVIVPMVYLGLERETQETDIDQTLTDGHTDVEHPTNELNKNKGTEPLDSRTYHVHATVLDDTWPLTKAEWVVVTEIREGTATADMRTKLSSVSHVGRSSKADFLRGKRSSKQLDDSRALERPYWVLQVVTDVGSGLEISQDRTKELEIARMKEEWARENPDSLPRGRELRRAFLKKHEIKSEVSLVAGKKGSLTSSKSQYTAEIPPPEPEVRTLTPPSMLRKLCPLDLSIYEVREEEEEKPWIKTEQDEEVLRCNRALNIMYAKEDHLHFVDDMQELLQTHKDRYRMFFSAHKDRFWETRLRLENAHEARNSYIGSMRSARVSTSKQPSSRKSRKSKIN